MNTLAYQETFLSSPESLYRPPMTSLFPSWMFWGGAVLFGMLAGLFYTADLKSVAIAVMAVYFGVAMLLSPQLSVYLFLAWQAWDGVFLSASDAVFTPAKAMAFVILLSYVIHMGRGAARMGSARSTIMWTVAYISYGLLGSVLSIAPLASVRYALQILVLLLVVMVGMRVLDTPERIRAAVFWLVVGTTMAATSVIISGESSKYSRSTLGEYNNPNSTALAISVGLAAVPGLWAFARRKWEYLLCAACGAIMMAGMMKTGSRSACAGIFLAYAVGGLIVKGHGWAKKIIATSFAIVFSFGVFLVVLNLNILPEKSQHRLEAMVGKGPENADEGSRMKVWKNALSTYLNQPVVGVGLGNTAFAQEKYLGHRLDVHSSLLGPLIDGGIIGCLLFYMILGVLFHGVYKIGVPNPGIPAAIMYSFLIISCISHTIHFTKWFWIPVLLCLLLTRHAEDVRGCQDTRSWLTL